LLGIYLAYVFYLRKPALGSSFNTTGLSHFFYSGWGFDRAYDFLFVKPLVWLADIDKNDFIDALNSAIARMTLLFTRLLSLTQNGKLRWYVMGFAIGIVFILTILMNL